jgi:DNA-binding Lrp family transcriptional regulator
MSRGTTETIDVRTVDRQLLEALRSGHSLGISDLTESLGVTATAVRQRIIENFSLASVVRQYEELYEDLIAKYLPNQLLF